MVLAIDVGNTYIKSAVFENNTFIEGTKFESNHFLESIEKIIKKYSKIKVIVVASVGKLKKEDFETLSNKVTIYYIDREKQLPFENRYSTPTTLGIDRIALAAGATLLFPNRNRFVIDAGTCVTYDFIDVNNIYYGGAISPGIRLRYEAMHNYTANLPLLSIEEPGNSIGNSTNQCIHSGVINGLTFEIEGFINQLTVEKENFIIILTGGDANFLAKRLKNTIFANSNFLLESLNQLYQYQINND